jgi:hypothetical protein
VRKMQDKDVFSLQMPSKAAKKDSMVLSFSEEDVGG